MQPIQFEESVISILKRDSQYDGQAYFFLKDALDFTLKRLMEEESGRNRHVSGEELLKGFRDYALEQFGPMAATLMEEWGITQCSDVGNMVFRLIEEQVFGRQDSDTREDFEGSFDLLTSLRQPFLSKARKRELIGSKDSVAG
ncbi:MAG: Minf_1886 family protein [Akkermansiaceae bacterium]